MGIFVTAEQSTRTQQPWHDKAMPPERRVELLLSAMTVEEKAAFTAGADFWTLVANARVGIPPIRVTDGPWKWNAQT